MGVEQVGLGLSSLTASFLQRTSGDVGRLCEMIERASKGDASALNEVQRLAHSIRGAAAMFGFPALSATAGKIESLIDEAAAGPVPRNSTGDSALWQQLTGCTTLLANEIDVAARNAPR
jgi:HPt (histidine-containing phosphotransfer) domain-containing protein